MSTRYALGLHDVAPGCAAYLQPDGSWGLSNAGVISDGGSALLVDTLYDLPRSRALLDAAGARGRIDVVVNTHANGDHCFGNQLVPERFPQARLLSSTATAREMPEVPPALMSWATRAMRVARALSPVSRAVPIGGTSLFTLADYWLRGFDRFEFGDVRLSPPRETFDGELALQVGALDVRLVELGPAHTRGDTIVWVPARRVLFTGDLLFFGGTPIVWAGPVSRWVAACEHMIALDPAIVVPGHGPLADVRALRDLRDYLSLVEQHVRARPEGSALDVARRLLASDAFRGGPWAGWSEAERVVVNVEAVLRELRGTPPKKPLVLFAWMAALAAERATGATRAT